MISKISIIGSNTPKQIIPLQEGINKIGRRSDDKQQPASDEILIETQDSSIHRQYHCIIEVVAKEKGYDYILSPFELATNPTYLDQELTPMHNLDAVYLKENSTFYVGHDTTITLTA